MDTRDGPILLVGCGKMGDALLKGWLGRGVAPTDVVVIEPTPAAGASARDRGANVVSDLNAIEQDFVPRIVIFAVKPQVMPDVVPAYRRFVAPTTTFLSIAAGRPLAFFATHLTREASVVRAMPNTPAAIGRGITVLCANNAATAADRALAETLMTAVGGVAWTADEALMDAVTAVSGSGPAYVFYMIECLAAAGVAAGLPTELAERLARDTVEGAAALSKEDGSSPTALRQNVASPGGTTAAALSVLMGAHGLQDVMTRAVLAAAARSRELAD
ncbi:MAG: pyrroline-5-carboxylate reductase [Alphaproteobacteria bacterium]|nr:pyrroline-5-carboxylate reductase [Alphaproteobacteria bacterium]